jgi:hypothetical protein
VWRDRDPDHDPTRGADDDDGESDAAAAYDDEEARKEKGGRPLHLHMWASEASRAWLSRLCRGCHWSRSAQRQADLRTT